MKKLEEKIKQLEKRNSALEKENKELRKRRNRFTFPEIREIVSSDGTTKKIR